MEKNKHERNAVIFYMLEAKICSQYALWYATRKWLTAEHSSTSFITSRQNDTLVFLDELCVALIFVICATVSEIEKIHVFTCKPYRNCSSPFPPPTGNIVRQVSYFSKRF